MDLFVNDNRLPFYIPDDDGYTVTWNEALHGFDITVPHGKLFYSEFFFSKKPVIEVSSIS